MVYNHSVVSKETELIHGGLDSVQILRFYAKHLAFAFQIISASLEKWCRRCPCEDLIQADLPTGCEGSSYWDAFP